MYYGFEKKEITLKHPHPLLNRRKYFCLIIIKERILMKEDSLYFVEFSCAVFYFYKLDTLPLLLVL